MTTTPPAPDAEREAIAVPRKPTREMWAAGGDAVVKVGWVHHDRIVEAFWSAMLAAAPQAAVSALAPERETPAIYGSGFRSSVGGFSALIVGGVTYSATQISAALRASAALADMTAQRDAAEARGAMMHEALVDLGSLRSFVGARTMGVIDAELCARIDYARAAIPPTEKQKAACRSIGTSQCAAICLSHPASGDKCPEITVVWTDEAIAKELRRRPNGPLAEIVS